jgi:hypothetical protein
LSIAACLSVWEQAPYGNPNLLAIEGKLKLICCCLTDEICGNKAFWIRA